MLDVIKLLRYNIIRKLRGGNKMSKQDWLDILHTIINTLPEYFTAYVGWLTFKHLTTKKDDN